MDRIIRELEREEMIKEHVDIKYYIYDKEKDSYFAKWEWNKSISENKDKLNGTISVRRSYLNTELPAFIKIKDPLCFVVVILEDNRIIKNATDLSYDINIPKKLRAKHAEGYSQFSNAWILLKSCAKHIYNEESIRQEYINKFAF